ncbi:hypothetical protein B5F08_12420 [Anaeromassilibacillus sp. An172]|uniref:hypothetical protein n=1 Tax=Anaeromassilibacillus sp. An172 TaxID=1965570 RepID=UPI000B36841F|nr:hypothetical protein [Anaeromassilibacillus sp. An172]OUP74005.1 hypothetical protein B5F08_12420 [Anaeromassilibacillus sp. An172]
MPSEEEYNNARENLKKINFHVDYIITHTAPSETVYYLSTLHNLGIKNNCTEELVLTTFLDDIQRNTLYKHWYFGHFHTDLDLWRNQTAIFSSIRDLKTGKIIKIWDPYEGSTKKREERYDYRFHQ